MTLVVNSLVVSSVISYNQNAYSSASPPQQNSVVKRKHGHINGVGRCFLNQASLPQEFWVDAYSSAVFFINQLPSSTINNVPLWVIVQLPSRLLSPSHIWVFVLPITPISQCNKLQSMATRCYFLGYASKHQGYRCSDLHTRKIIISCDTIFNELEFPFWAQTTANLLAQTSVPNHLCLLQPAILTHQY